MRTKSADSRCGTLINRPKYLNITIAHFIAALFVLVSHAFPLSGFADGEWFNILTEYQITMGGFAVFIFFFTGGYLIAKSMSGKKTFPRFFSARCRRIFPPLLCAVVLSAFLIGPLMTVIPLREYFKDVQTYGYLLNGFLLLRHELPGVFTHNTYTATVNGSLWTLPIEFLCYIACYVMYLCGFFSEKKCLWSLPIVAAGEVFILWLARFPMLKLFESVFLPTLLFYFGILFYIFRKKIPIHYGLMLLMTLLFILLVKVDLLTLGVVLFLPYILYALCFGPKQYTGTLPFFMECNYEIYLLAFPIQQSVISWFGGQMNPYLNILISLPLTMLTAALLNKILHFVKFIR